MEFKVHMDEGVDEDESCVGGVFKNCHLTNYRIDSFSSTRLNTYIGKRLKRPNI